MIVCLGMFIDLTLPIDINIPVFPGSPSPKISQFATIDIEGWNEKLLNFTSHFSTHIDAPKHMIESGKTLSDYPIDSFIGETVLFDVCNQPIIDVDVSEVKSGDIVFFFTGHSKHIYEKDYFDKYPLISERTIQRLISKNISILGIDSFTPDNEPYLIHKLLFSHNIRIVEQLTNLEQLHQKRFKCYIFPLNITNADGSPCRVVAEIENIDG